ncbi:hypothetical protein BGX38DRAFT_282799 [Terfezia claveryi]|nr:hypothetical protein BGX38DRAFT_282799 [Terfezia claveryi]
MCVCGGGGAIILHEYPIVLTEFWEVETLPVTPLPPSSSDSGSPNISPIGPFSPQVHTIPVTAILPLVFSLLLGVGEQFDTAPLIWFFAHRALTTPIDSPSTSLYSAINFSPTTLTLTTQIRQRKTTRSFWHYTLAYLCGHSDAGEAYGAITSRAALYRQFTTTK